MSYTTFCHLASFFSFLFVSSVHVGFLNVASLTSCSHLLQRNTVLVGSIMMVILHVKAALSYWLQSLTAGMCDTPTLECIRRVRYSTTHAGVSSIITKAEKMWKKKKGMQ